MPKFGLFFLFICFSLLSTSNLDAEEIVSTKKEEPDAYYGLKVGAIVTPTLTQRMRDGKEATRDISPSDRSGFSLPWTLLMISKEWAETGLQVEFWGEILRSDSVTNDTRATGGNQENPYLFVIRRANVSKTWTGSTLNQKVQFGMIELPHMFSVWSGYYDWRYLERSPLESLAFAKDPVDLGVQYFASWRSLSLQIALVNGDGYRAVQNTTNSGFDGMAKLSWEESSSETWRAGLHLLARSANFAGATASECWEGRSCLSDDGDPRTRREANLNLSREFVYALEANLIYRGIWNLGLGGMAKKKPGGEIVDRNNLTQPPEQLYERTGRGVYTWLGVGNRQFRMFLRGEMATGGPQTGVVTTETLEREPWIRFGDTSRQNLYSDQSYTISRQIYFEWLYNPDVRFAVGYTELKSFDRDGEPNKWYVDSQNELRSKQEYRNQFISPTLNPISEYGRLDRSIVLKATATF